MVDVIRGKYQIVREIARSNDIVYEAVDTTLGRRIAIKELNLAPSMVGQARRERIERFTREARAVGRLSHPNIVSVFDFGEERGRHFIAMEFLEGQTLREILQMRGALPLKESLDIACQVLDALAYAHASHVIHRDIKPDNIHILPNGQIKLTDFGIARLTEEPALTNTGQVFGTPSYMAPEQIEGRDIDHRSDLFSVGVVLYEMLAGRKPFMGDSVVSITYAVMHAEPLALSNVPPGVEQVVRRALSKNPNQRQSSAEQMKLDLRAAEQTPSLFLPASSDPSRSGPIGLKFGYQGSAAPADPLSGSLDAGSWTGSSAGYASLPASASALPPAASNGAQPWNWNNPGIAGGNLAAPLPSQQMPASWMPPGGISPLPMRPSEPLFVLSPDGRAFLLSVLVAVLLGGGIAMGVIGFLHSYDQYRVSAGAQRIAMLINRGVNAYNGRDYRAAAGYFGQALAANPGARDRETLQFNLAATDIQLARVAEAEGRWQDAREACRQALEVAPDNKTAHSELASVLEHLGETGPAQKERNAALESIDSGETPASLNSHSNGGGTESNAGSQQSLDERRSQANQLIQEGDQLAHQNDLDGAKEKWLQAIQIAPGTPERDAAMQRLSQTQQRPSSSNP